ncbi:D-alanyl-lipoteichoic acid acyltransferase DltB, MBOAT superfamily [Aquimarina amphilecti]|uniref:D-alanyl-lipoteichoic acid acyltransferase DltB, MBOAT superfamily n=1 Tax=Aquimarina amphilecti TaxID=1038014 RepID=A0A1H7HSU7_AQUAM|nr:MBOAT family O-acyltransferase [Aquimarina amphilecti]SEK53339.1 D-alanyl-lipoteichoic acid acyltransferase DltB, MBOAT superfamily [Aquimarina amphilecti]
MYFNSFDFLIFLPIVFVAYWLFEKRKIRFQNVILLIASYVFYGWWDWRFLSLIGLSTLVDYFVGIRISLCDTDKLKKRWLLVSIFFNLGVLSFFKYCHFFIDSWVDLCNSIGYDIKDVTTLNIILPVGISFYTFQTMSYTIDVYRDKLKPTKDFISFAAFVSFFPQLVAGPIERATHLLPQFLKERKYSKESISYGIKLIIWGFFLKLVLADRTAIYVNSVYNNVEYHDGLSLIFATILFAFQIYGDFAGYSLIAIGTAKLFGFDLMTNFRRPYFSGSIHEFWNRWHISLSTWFRDYLYIPLGGNRVGRYRWFFNLFITFLISGLWHGAKWTFVIWGAINGIYLIIEILCNGKKRKGILNIISTFCFISFAWIFFRANSVNDAFYIINKIFTEPGKLYIGSGDDIAASLYAVLAIFLLVIIEFKREYLQNITIINFFTKKEIGRMFMYATLIYLILYLGVFGHSQFIYFQF